jgi:HEAT repeat protein
MYELRPDVPVMTAVGIRVAAKDPAFTTRLVEHVRRIGASSYWAATILLAAGDRRVVPIVTTWLRSRAVDARIAGAAALERADAAEAQPALPALLEAVRAEPDDSARGMELSAIARIADRRALAPLLAIATTATTHRIALANALGRIKDPRALDALAKLALDAGSTDLQGAQEAVNAFCWISGLCAAHAPSDSPGGTVDPSYIQAGQAIIARWRANRRP